MAATKNARTASWRGLLLSGVERCVEVKPELVGRWAERRRDDIQNGAVAEMIAAADLITDQLSKPSPGDFKKWLKDEVGSLQLKDRLVLDALLALGVPLTTTNYDHLIEQALPQDPPPVLVSWKVGDAVESLIRDWNRGEVHQGVLHLHGRWDQPESVVLGTKTYEAVRLDDHLQTVLKSLRLSKHLLFVGCGEGLADPNFGEFLAWTRHVFAGSTFSQYCLVREGERERLECQHPRDERIEFVTYGKDFCDLDPFLKTLVPPKLNKASKPIPPTKRARRPNAGQDKPNTPDVPPTYRAWVKRECGSIELLGLRLKQGQSVRIGSVYVPLTTSLREEALAGVAPEADQKLEGSTMNLFGRGQDAPLLLSLVGRHSLYVSGAPGAGKSTFCRWLAWLLAEGTMPAVDPAELKDARQEHYPQALDRKLPVLIRLRDFHAALAGGRELTAHQFEGSLERWLNERKPGELTWPALKACLRRGEAVMIFDGADEVPAARRSALFSGLAQCLPDWEQLGNRTLLTSRPYGLADAEIRRLGLPHAPLDTLPEEFQQQLVRRWFRILIDDPESATSTANGLLADARQRPWLQPLAENPLLLTAMCIVYGQGKRLPQDKHDLYDRIVDTVLHNRFPPDEVCLVRNRLAVIAHGMHTGVGLGETRETPEAQTTEDEIDRMIEVYQHANYTEEGFKQVNEARDQLLSQSGLLLPLESRRASFYHLSFQEFLAAERMADVDRERLLTVFGERGDRPEWRNTLSFLFGDQLANNVAPTRAVDLLVSMLDGFSDTTSPAQIVLAADGVEILGGRRVRLQEPRLAGLRRLCQDGMRGMQSAVERCALAEALGRIGDPRFRADAWYLPADEMLGFIEIPGGPFLMGSDKSRDPNAREEEMPQFTVDLPSYFIARYPVTVAQFRSFVEDTESNGGFMPGNPDCLRGVENHPVAYVSWHEAMAYCQWLTTKLGVSELTPRRLRQLLVGKQEAMGWRVTLPSEAEWEKAARGTDGRIFPWGDQLDSDKCNYGHTSIGSRNAVGCFPRGVSPYGVEETIGNVFEWCQDWFGPYRRQLFAEPRGPKKGRSRVLRGGSWGDSAEHCRSAFRVGGRPSSGDYGLGFRVVLTARPGAAGSGE